MHTNKLMQKWEEDRLKKHMERKINSAKASGASNSGSAKSTASPVKKGSPAKGAKSTSFGQGGSKTRRTPRKQSVPKENLDEEISARLQQVLRGVAPLNAPRKPDVCDRAGAEKKEGRGEEVAEEICEEPFVAATVFSSQDRYGRPLSRANSNADSVDDETIKTAFTHLEVEQTADVERLSMPMHSPHRPHRNPRTQKNSDSKSQAMLSQSLAHLQLLVNAKIEDLVEAGRQRRTKIPAAPGQVRPVTARTRAATKIPGMSPSKGTSAQSQGAEQAVRSSVIVEEAQLANSMDSDSISLTGSHQSGSSHVSPKGSPSKLQRTVSGGSGSSSGIRDSTEIGLGQLREAAVADSLMDTAGISEFVNAHRTLMNTELAETSTDQLLSNFLQDRSESLATPNLRGDRNPSGAQRRIDAGDVLDGDEYSDDDFEEFEDDNTVPQGDGHGRICSQAKALYGSLYELQTLMKSPHASRRPTMTDTESMIPEEDSYLMAEPASERTLSTAQLSHACSILEDTFRRGGSIPAFELGELLVQKL